MARHDARAKALAAIEGMSMQEQHALWARRYRAEAAAWRRCAERIPEWGWHFDYCKKQAIACDKIAALEESLT